jgi:hypothetical protein
MTDADFSSSTAAPDTGASPSPSPPVDVGGAAEAYSPQSDGDGNQFSGGAAKTVDMHGPARDGHDDGEQPVDLDIPRSWQTPEIRAELEALVREQREQPQAKPQPPQRPQDFPRSWANDPDAIGVWNTLPEQAREQIRTRENQRDGEVTRRQSEFAEHTRATEFALRHAEQVTREAWAALTPELEPYADLFEPGRLAAERQANPQRAQAFEQLFNRAEALRLSGQQILEARAEQHRAQVAQAQEKFFTDARAAWEQQKAAHDAEAERLIPDLKDPVKREEITKAVYDYTDKLGISRQQLHHWFETEPLLRGAAGQKVLHDAAMWHRAQRAAFEAKPKQAPKPMMPGTNNGSGGRGDDAAAAAKEGNMSAYFRIRDSQDRRARR